jgi:stringent starvation protein B
MAELTSRRPYLIRALYDWVLDNDLTPHLLVAADADGVDVPRQFVTEDGKITVNISPGAVRGLSLGNDLVTFSARFSGQSYNVSLPPGAVLALYARENGEGMLFGEVETPPTPPEGGPGEKSEAESDGETGEQKKHPHLKVVK